MTVPDKSLLDRVARGIGRPGVTAPAGVTTSILAQAATSYGARPVYDESTVPTGFDPASFSGLPDLPGLRLEHVDERVSDDLPLALGIGYAGKLPEKQVARVDHPKVDAEVPTEGMLHLLALVQPQQSVIDEDAGQPVTDRAMDQRRRD